MALIVVHVKMKVLVHPLHALIKDYGIVVMDSVFLNPMYVMALMNFVMQAGVQTVPMAQMKA